MKGYQADVIEGQSLKSFNINKSQINTSIVLKSSVSTTMSHHGFAIGHTPSNLQVVWVWRPAQVRGVRQQLGEAHQAR